MSSTFQLRVRVWIAFPGHIRNPPHLKAVFTNRRGRGRKTVPGKLSVPAPAVSLRLLPVRGTSAARRGTVRSPLSAARPILAWFSLSSQLPFSRSVLPSCFDLSDGFMDFGRIDARSRRHLLVVGAFWGVRAKRGSGHVLCRVRLPPLSVARCAKPRYRTRTGR